MSLDAMISQARARQVERESERERQQLAEEQEARATARETLVERLKSTLGQQFLSLCAIGYNEAQKAFYAHIVRNGADVLLYYRVEGEIGMGIRYAYWEVITLSAMRRIKVFYDGWDATPEEVCDGIMLAIDELTK